MYCGGRFVSVLYGHSLHRLDPCGDGGIDDTEQIIWLGGDYIILFHTKKKKIKDYLENAALPLSAFDGLLSDYISGELKARLLQLGIEKIETYIDWLDNYRCIGVQGRYRKNYVELQIEEKEFSIGYDTDEPDDPQTYPLETKEQVYSVMKDILKNLS